MRSAQHAATPELRLPHMRLGAVKAGRTWVEADEPFFLVCIQPTTLKVCQITQHRRSSSNHAPASRHNRATGSTGSIGTQTAWSLRRDNVVSACTSCNDNKGSRTWESLVAHVRRIANANPGGGYLAGTILSFRVYHSVVMQPNPQQPRLPPPLPLARGKARHPEADVDLPASVCLELCINPCYLCGTAPAMGVDAIDPRQWYSAPGNVAPCCTECNSALLGRCIPTTKPTQFANGTTRDFLQRTAYIVQHYQGRCLSEDAEVDKQRLIHVNRTSSPVAASIGA